MATHGVHTQRNSESNTSTPSQVMKSNPIGETWIGFHGKKKRAFDSGHKNAMPAPPLVHASIMPWEAFQGLSDDDLRSIHRYLRQVPPNANDVGPVRRAAK